MDAPDGGNLTVLPAGPTPPNPAALLGSQPMREMVQELERQADLVIVDSVAALAVSDALPLLRAVSEASWSCAWIAPRGRPSAGCRR